MKKTASLRLLVALSMAAVAGPAVAGAQQTNRRSRGGAVVEGGAKDEVELACDLLELRPGMVVAEVGAGSGSFALQLAEHVRPGGHVYVNELGDPSVSAIKRRIAAAGVDDVEAVKGDVDDTNLPEGQIDALMMRRVYHMMTDPGSMNRSFFRALKPGGRMLIIEGYPQNGRNAPGVPANRSGMGIDSRIAIDEVEAVGFELVRVVDPWPNVGYAMLFRKPAV